MRNTVTSFLAFCICSAALLSGCTPVKGNEYSRTLPVMGTYLQVKLGDPAVSREKALNAIDEAFRLAEYLEKVLSIYYPDSEVNVLNRSKSLNASEDLYSVISIAEKIGRSTDGGFDITVAPVMRDSGLYAALPEKIRDTIPAGYGGLGWRNVEIDRAGRKIELRNGAWVDLSGIAKGYIVDRIYGLFREKGIKGVLVNAGGDMYCGPRPGGKPWNIGVRDPGSGSIAIVLRIYEGAVATSGDYENVVFNEAAGSYFSHIIDPGSEVPLIEAPSGITVITGSAARADALATGMMAMGPERAVLLAELQDDVEVLVIDEKNGEKRTVFSKGAERYFPGEYLK
ncbi:MAG: hypothetical protein GF408_08640 [Candidatus Omnitrophica bacterium]|nr:hypothetical protein [Candidatus Omnitrophota bacterium]